MCREITVRFTERLPAATGPRLKYCGQLRQDNASNGVGLITGCGFDLPGQPLVIGGNCDDYYLATQIQLIPNFSHRRCVTHFDCLRTPGFRPAWRRRELPRQQWWRRFSWRQRWARRRFLRRLSRRRRVIKDVWWSARRDVRNASGRHEPRIESRGGERGSAYGRADTSPGWHSMGGSSAGRGEAGRSGNMAGASGARGAMEGHGTATMHAALADGQWHSFGGTHGSAHATLATGLNGNARFGGREDFIHGGWGGSGWHGGFGGWRGGWGYPGYGFGFGCWGCGWGYGFGWGIGWNPYWAFYPYPYWDNLWWGDPYGYFGPPDIYPYAY